MEALVIFAEFNQHQSLYYGVLFHPLIRCHMQVKDLTAIFSIGISRYIMGELP